MEMFNRAFEDAAAFQKFKRNLTEKQTPTSPVATNQKRPGENRQQYRARLRAEQTK